MSKAHFWTDDPLSLFASLNILPSSNGDAIDNLNALTRLAIVSSLGITLFDPVAGAVAFVASIVAILAVYFACVNGKVTGVRESFEDVPMMLCGGGGREIAIGGSTNADATDGLSDVQRACDVFCSIPPPVNSDGSVKRFNERTANRFCNDFQALCDVDRPSVNQMLVGFANPKTYTPPIVSIPSHETKEWRVNDLVVRSAINDSSNYDDERSGYTQDTMVWSAVSPSSTMRGGGPPFDVDRQNLPPVDKLDRVATQTIQPGMYQKTLMNEPINSNIGISYTKQFDPMIVANTCIGGNETLMYATADGNVSLDITEHELRNPNYRRAVLPSYATTNSNYIPNYNPNYNPNYIPGTRNEFNPPPPHLLGSSTWEYQDGSTIPSIGPAAGVLPSTPILEKTTLNAMLQGAGRYPREPTIQTEYNVFDPRFTGYGSNDRSYVDGVTGQPRFAYDDVDSVRMPNYVTRSNIDVFPWAPQYGPDEGTACRNGSDYRQLANDQYLDSTLQFRTEMQQRLMRKRNAEMWQLRVAPISTQPRLR